MFVPKFLACPPAHGQAPGVSLSLSSLPPSHPMGILSWAPHLCHGGSGRDCVLKVCARRSGPGGRAWGRHRRLGAGRCGGRATAWRGCRARCSATRPGCPPGSASTSTRGGIARAARLRAGSSALPAASRWAVGLSWAPPRVRGRKREYRRAGPGRLRPLGSPRQAPRLRLLESQGPDIRDLEPPQATHPKAVAPTPQQPPPQVPRLPAGPCQPTTAAALRPARPSARRQPGSAPRVLPCISASVPHQWAFTLPPLFPSPSQPFLFARPSLKIQYQIPAQPLLPSHSSPPPALAPSSQRLAFSAFLFLLPVYSSQAFSPSPPSPVSRPCSPNFPSFRLCSNPQGH